jgi:hypothetical protein
MLKHFNLNNQPANHTQTPKKQRYEGNGLFNKSGVNLRAAVRYGMVNDSKTELCSKKYFLFAKPFEIELLDISSRGACIASKRKLRINSRFILKVTFADGKSFEIPGKVVHNDFKDENCYGFKFDAHNAELGDYLFKTQTDSIL